MTVFEFCSFNIWSYRITEQTWARTARFSGMNANPNFDQNLSLFVCVWTDGKKKKQTGQRQPRNRDSVGSSIVGNKLIPTSREPMGVGETPGLFPGKQSSISSSTPQNLSLPLSLSLSMSLSLSLLHAPMFFLGGVEEEGDDEVTHCNIIAMAMKSEPREEERKRMGISIGGGEMEMAVTISVLKLKMEISVWCYLYWNISLPKTHISTFPCLLFHLLLHSAFASVFLLDSSPCVLLPLLLARCAPPHMLSKEYVFRWCITLSHVARVFRHAEVKCYVMLTYARLASRQGQRWSHGTERRGEVNWGQWNTSRRKNKEKL